MNEMITILRALIQDDGTPQTYTDARLTTALTSAAQMVAMEAEFSQSFTANVLLGTITPDPEAEETRDTPFIVLTTLKAACRLARGEAKISGGQAIRVRDGTSEVDLKDAAKYKNETANSLCKEYQDAKFEYETTGNVGNFAVSTTPFRLLVGGNRGTIY